MHLPGRSGTELRMEDQMKRQEIENRRRQIIEHIQRKGSLSTEYASRLFHVSDETIRKDFAYLEKMQIVEKFYGGARLLNQRDNLPYTIREDIHYDAKRSIALKALSLIPDKEINIGLDMGSTVSILTDLIPPHSPQLFITNSNIAAQKLLSKEDRLFLLGGDYDPDRQCYQCEPSVQILHHLSLDLVFLGTGGVENLSGISTTQFKDVKLKQEFISRSRMKIVLADSSKFSGNSLVQVAEWSEVDILITDSGIPREAADDLSKKVDLIIV